MAPERNWLAHNNLSRSTCTSWLRGACVPSAPLTKQVSTTKRSRRSLVGLRAAHSNSDDVLQPIMHPFSIRAKGAFGELPSLMQDLASFLLTRGCTLTAC